MFFDLNVGALAEPVSGRRWERSEILEQVARRVAAVPAPRPGTRPARLPPFGNKLEFFAELLAIWKLGACAVPIDARLTSFEVTNLAEAAQPKLAVIDAKTDPVAPGSGRNRGHRHRYPGHWRRHCRCRAEPSRRRRADPLHHFGFHRRAQGVVHTIVRCARAGWVCGINSTLPTSGVPCASCPPISATASSATAYSPGCRARICTSPPFQADIIMRLGKLLDDNRITFMSSVPAVWKLALKMAKPLIGQSAPGSRRLGTAFRPHLGRDPSVDRDASGVQRLRHHRNGKLGRRSGQRRLPAEDGLIGTGWGPW